MVLSSIIQGVGNLVVQMINIGMVINVLGSIVLLVHTIRIINVYMSQPLKINVVLNIIGMVKHVTIININVLMEHTGKVLFVSQQVHVNKDIIKIKEVIVYPSLKLVFHQQYGMVRNVRLMEHVHQVHIRVEAVARVMFLVRMVMYGIVNILHVVVQLVNNQMDMHVYNVQVENIGLLV